MQQETFSEYLDRKVLESKWGSYFKKPKKNGQKWSLPENKKR